jgi:hypothetical protein
MRERREHASDSGSRGLVFGFTSLVCDSGIEIAGSRRDRIRYSFVRTNVLTSKKSDPIQMEQPQGFESCARHTLDPLLQASL